MTTDYRALCAELLDEIQHESPLTCIARAALAQPQPPADGEVGELVEWLRLNAEDYARDDCPESAAHFTRAADLLERLAATGEPALQVEPTDREVLELMPGTMRDEFSHAAKACSDATGGQVKPGIFRVCLNTSALEFARAVLARWGRPSPQPIPVSERLPEAGDCDAEGCIWLWDSDRRWVRQMREAASSNTWIGASWLPGHVLPLPAAEVK